MPTITVPPKTTRVSYPTLYLERPRPGSPRARESWMAYACRRWVKLSFHDGGDGTGVWLNLAVDGRRFPDLLALVRGAAADGSPAPVIDMLMGTFGPADPVRWFAEAGRVMLADPGHEVRRGRIDVRYRAAGSVNPGSVD